MEEAESSAAAATTMRIHQWASLLFGWGYAR
jgi:hypothetical protein